MATSPLGAASVDLAALLATQSSVVLNPADTYYLPPTGYDAGEDKTITGNGASVTVQANPLKVRASATLSVSDCVFVSGTGWGLLSANESGTLVLDGCSVTGNGSNTGIYVSDTATLRARESNVQSCTFGLNAMNTVTLDLTNTSFSDCCYGVQQDAGTLSWNGGTVSQSAGVGVFLNRGSAIVSNVTVSQVEPGGIGFNMNDTTTVFSNVSVNQNASNGIGFQQAAGTLTWNGGTVNQSTGVGISMNSGTVDISDVAVIQSLSGGIGFNLLNSTSGALHGVHVQGADHAVQIHQGAIAVDEGSILVGGHGSGIAINAGGAVIVRDSFFTYFQNAIDVQPHVPAGTADIEGCSFYTCDYSAVSVVDAHDVRMADCLVQDAQADGVFYVRSTGSIENCRVIRSVMTGVTFMGCEAGDVVVRDCLIEGCGHQGVAVVKDDQVPSHPTLGAQVLNNTILGSAICNLLVDEISTAYMQGNICAQAEDFSIRFQKTNGVRFDSGLVIDSRRGIEIQDSDVDVVLSSVAGHHSGGVLAYLNAAPTFRCSDFRCNDQDYEAHDYSLFVTDGATANVQGCNLGLCGEWGLYNNSRALSTDATQNYWGTDLGPKEQWYGQSPGASAEWNYEVGASVAFSPWLFECRVDCNYTAAASLLPGAAWSWDSNLGAALALTGQTGAGGQGAENQAAGVLRCYDASDLAGIVALPDDFISGHLYAVWVAYPLRDAAQEGSITFSAPDVTAPCVALTRREVDGSWTRQNEATWVSANRILVFSPSDMNLLNGTFALVVDTSVSTPTPPPLPLSARDWQLFD